MSIVIVLHNVIFFQDYEKKNKCVYFIVFLLADADKMYYTSVLKILIIEHISFDTV